MKARSRGKSKALALVATGALLLSGPSCLPNDFLYTYGGQAGISLINALTYALAFNVADALVPPADTTN